MEPIDVRKHDGYMRPRQGHHRLRAGRWTMPGQAYLITTTTHDRKPLFADREAAFAACRAGCDPASWGDAQLDCWVLMPDHWHGLVRLGDTDSLDVVINRFKARVAKSVRRAVPAIQRVWARAYHDRALRRDEVLIDVARYIVLNPVRAGIARRVGDYPFWGAVWL